MSVPRVSEDKTTRFPRHRSRVTKSFFSKHDPVETFSPRK